MKICYADYSGLKFKEKIRDDFELSTAERLIVLDEARTRYFKDIDSAIDKIKQEQIGEGLILIEENPIPDEEETDLRSYYMYFKDGEEEYTTANEFYLSEIELEE